jgi:hypothetical protein
VRTYVSLNHSRRSNAAPSRGVPFSHSRAVTIAGLRPFVLNLRLILDITFARRTEQIFAGEHGAAPDHENHVGVKDARHRLRVVALHRSLIFRIQRGHRHTIFLRRGVRRACRQERRQRNRCAARVFNHAHCDVLRS